MKKRSIIFLILLIFFTLNILSFAHSGRTDSSGGHKDNKNASGLGYYHYHCGGHPPHLHSNGICPYNKKTATKKISAAKTVQSSTAKVDENKKIQIRLNELGYNCGDVDGSIGPKTKASIKAFQKDKGLEVDGIAGPITKRTLGLN